MNALKLRFLWLECSYNMRKNYEKEKCDRSAEILWWGYS